MSVVHEAGTEPAAGPVTDPPPWAQGWRRRALAAGMLVYPLVAAAGVSQYSRGGDAPTGYLILAGFSACYVLAIISAARHSWPRFWLLLGAMTVLFVAETPFARAQAFLLCAVIVSMAAANLRRFAAPIVVTGVLASLVVPWAWRPWHTGPGWFEAVAIVFTVLTVNAFSEITLANRALLEARAEIAQLASEAERSRIARDLHDLLGHSLTAITVKAGLARRLAGSDPARSLREIIEVEDLTRGVLADVRAAVSNYRDVSLAGELARGRELLRASGVAADLPTATDVVDATHQELLAWAVREGLTNVVRHAHATRCTVLLSASDVEIRDDGVGSGPASADDAPAGNGLAGLRERVAAAGGSMEAGPLSPRGWRLRVALAPAVGATA